MYAIGFGCRRRAVLADAVVGCIHASNGIQTAHVWRCQHSFDVHQEQLVYFVVAISCMEPFSDDVQIVLHNSSSIALASIV